MIQRIQSVWLLLSGIVSIALLFIPVASIQGSEELQKLTVMDQPVLLALNLLIFLFSFGAIFLYGNRKLQMRICFLCGMFAVLLATLMFFMFTQKMGGQPEIAMAMPVAIVLFCFLAISGIKKDIKLIKSLDRLR